MSIYTYSRVSCDKQTTDTQEVALRERFPSAEMHQETASGVKSRPVLTALLSRLTQGDTLAVAALDRLGRKTSEILTLLEDLHKRGVNVVSLREGLDYSTPAGKLVTQVLVSVSELERSLISQRTKAALAAKKAQGVRLGRPVKYASEDKDTVLSMRSRGYTFREIAKATGMSLGTVGSVLKGSAA